MIDLQQTTNALLSFLTTPNKDWSFCTLSFMVAFLVFFAVYLYINRYRKAWLKAYVVLFGLLFAYKANGTLIRRVEVVRKLETHECCNANRHIAITRKIAIDLQGKAQNTH